MRMTNLHVLFLLKKSENNKNFSKSYILISVVPHIPLYTVHVLLIITVVHKKRNF